MVKDGQSLVEVALEQSKEDNTSCCLRVNSVKPMRLRYTMEELFHLGSLPEFKVPLATVDWENDISLKWLDQRSGRKKETDNNGNEEETIALKPHWMRAGAESSLYRSASNDNKSSPIPAAGPMRSRLVDGAAVGDGEMSSSMPASGSKRISDRNGGHQRGSPGWRPSMDKEGGPGSHAPRSPQHSYERPGMMDYALRGGDTSAKQRWVDQQGNNRWRAAQNAKGGGQTDAQHNHAKGGGQTDAQHDHANSSRTSLEDRWKTPEDDSTARMASTETRSRQSNRWGDDERRGRPSHHHNHHRAGNSNQYHNDPDDDKPAWMAPEPVPSTKMTPADVERERQAFREQHSKAKQQQQPMPQKEKGRGVHSDVFEEVDLDELMDDDQRMQKNLPPAHPPKSATLPVPEAAPPQGTKMSYNDLVQAMSSSKAATGVATPTQATPCSGKAMTLGELEKQLQDLPAPAQGAAPKEDAQERVGVVLPRAARLGPPPGMPHLKADLNASRTLLSMLKGTASRPASATTAPPEAAATPQNNPGAPTVPPPADLPPPQQLQQHLNLMHQLQQGAAQQPPTKLLQELLQTAAQQPPQQQVPQQQKPPAPSAGPTPPLLPLKPSAPPLAPSLGIPKPHIPAGVLTAFGEKPAESNASIWGGPLGTLSNPMPLLSSSAAIPSANSSSPAPKPAAPTLNRIGAPPDALAALFARGASAAGPASLGSSHPFSALPPAQQQKPTPPLVPQHVTLPHQQQQLQLPPNNPLLALFARANAAQAQMHQQQQQQQQQQPHPNFPPQPQQQVMPAPSFSGHPPRPQMPFPFPMPGAQPNLPPSGSVSNLLSVSASHQMQQFLSQQQQSGRAVPDTQPGLAPLSQTFDPFFERGGGFR